MTRAGLAPSAERIGDSRVRPVERREQEIRDISASDQKKQSPTAPSSTSRIPHGI